MATFCDDDMISKPACRNQDKLWIKEIAKHIVHVAFRSESNLNELIPLLKEHCGEAEYKKFVKGIAKASSCISEEILNLVFKDFPDIKSDLDEKINKYGKLI